MHIEYLFMYRNSAETDMFTWILRKNAESCPSPVSTAEGWLQRVVILGTETHVIEEIQLFETAQPVDSLTISHSKVTRRELDVSPLF